MPVLASEFPSFLVIGHRGVPRLAPENSASAFKLAHRLGIPMVELDVRLSRDRELVVIHDGDIKKVSDGKGKVSQRDFRYLRQFDYGSWFHSRFRGEKLLRLDEALELLLPGVGVILDLKEDKKRRREMAEALVKNLEKRSAYLAELIVCSFSDKLLLEVQKLNPSIWLGLIFRTKPKKAFHKAFEFGFNSVHPHQRVAKESLLQWARSHDLEIFVWTVNSFKSVKKWKSLGVRGVITDIPERLVNLI